MTRVRKHVNKGASCMDLKQTEMFYHVKSWGHAGEGEALFMQLSERMGL